MRIKSIAYLVFTLPAFCAYAQKGYVLKKFCKDVPLPSVMQDRDPIWHEFIDDDLYMAFPHHDSLFDIYKLDGGAIWSKYPTIALKDENNGIIYPTPEVYNGELYLTVASKRINEITRKGSRIHIIKFNGKKWDTLPSYPNIPIEGCYHLKVFKNKLYYTAEISNPGTYGSSALFCLDSAGKTKMVARCDAYPSGISALETSGDRLVIGGQFDSLNGISFRGLAFYNGLNFTGANTAKPACYKTFFKRNDSQILIEDCKGLELWENDSLLIKLGFPVTWDMYGYRGYTFYKQYIFTTQINYWSGYYYYDLDSFKWNHVPSSHMEAQLTPINAGPEHAAFFYLFSKPVQILEFVPGALFTGKLYADRDSNCSINIGDFVLKNTLCKLKGDLTDYYTTSDTGGNYEVYVSKGDYFISPIIPQSQAAISTCMKDKITVQTGTSYKINVPVKLPKEKNLGVKLNAASGFRVRQGFMETYDLTCVNLNRRSDSCVVRLEFPSNVTLIQSSILPFSSDSTALLYKFYGMEFNQPKNVRLGFKTALSSSSLGETLVFTANILNSAGDAIISNNRDTLRQKIVAAFDPNVKQCYPEGSIDYGPKKIKYVVHFQNTGNDTAYNISVVDTLNPRFDLSSLQITGSSCPELLSIRIGNMNSVIFDFANILLPDSHTNEKASHGYVSFEVDHPGSLKVGNSITNKASIYFDYQKAVITNTASILRVKPVGVAHLLTATNENLHVFPNPCSTYATVVMTNGKDLAGRSVYLYNSNGCLLNEFILDTNGHVTLNTSQYSNGIYFINIYGTAYSTTLIINK